MKNRLINYLAGIGVPLGAFGAGAGCTGVCGSCRLSCAPGIFAVLVLTGNMLYKKWKARTGQCHG